MPAKLEVSIGQFSDCGAKPVNQDFYGVLIPEEPFLTNKGVAAVIADGMSGSDAAARASEYSVKSFLTDYFSTPESWTVKKSGDKVLSALNRWLYSQGQVFGDPTRGLVTTFSALVIKSTTAYLFHVGDTRIYQVRNGQIELLTQDHHAWISREKNYLNRAMGVDLFLEIDYRSLPVEQGDIYLFTSDGVHEYLRQRDLAALLAARSGNLDKAAERIVSAARANSSPDNLTCQILRVDALASQDVASAYQRLTELPFAPDLEAGMILDGYCIQRELHASSTTQLYLAIDTENGEPVVIKSPSVNYEDDPAYLERFLHEEWVGKRINDAHVLKVYPRMRRRRFLYYVTEYLEGKTLRQWMHDNPLPSMDLVRDLVGQLVQGVRAFHRLEMLHQDLKPENILIDRLGTVKIIDFGSVKIAGIGEINSPIERAELLGTKNYTAPEYLLGSGASNRSDLFSLGIITYEMLTGRLPYGEALSRNCTARRLRKLTYISACEYREDLPLWLDRALAKAVCLEPSGRYAALSEFLFDLSHPNPEFMRPRERQPLLERNPLRFWQGLSALLLLGNLLLVYWLVGR